MKGQGKQIAKQNGDIYEGAAAALAGFDSRSRSERRPDCNLAAVWIESNRLDQNQIIGLPVREYESVQNLALQLTCFRVSLEAFETGKKGSNF